MFRACVWDGYTLRKTAQPIDMPFGVRTLEGLRNNVLGMDAILTTGRGI